VINEALVAHYRVALGERRVVALLPSYRVLDIV
jgi:hypothetical protein